MSPLESPLKASEAAETAEPVEATKTPEVTTLTRLLENQVRRGPELTTEIRARILGAHDAGAGYKKIAAMYKIPRSTVRGVIKRNNPHSAPRSGRPRSYTDDDLRAILEALLSNPNATNQEIRASSGVQLSQKLVTRLLKEHRSTHHASTARPKITAKPKPKVKPQDATVLQAAT